MSLREKISEQLNAALKNKNKTLVSTLRLIIAAIKERDIANRTSEKKEPVKDVEIIKVLFLLFSAALNCSFIFSRKDMIVKILIYCTRWISSKEKNSILTR